MPGDETKQAEEAVAAAQGDASAPPPPPELPLEWAYLENGARQDSGAAVCVIEDDKLFFRCKSGPPFDLKYSDIERVEDPGVNLLLTMRDGSAVELSKLARLHDMLRGALLSKWTALNRKQALAEETLIARFSGRAARGDDPLQPAGVGVYETALVLDFETGEVERIPLAFCGRPQDTGHSFVFSPPGERWTVGFLGRETERFRQAVEQAVSALEEKAQKRVRALCPALPPFKARALVGKFLDGLAVPVKAARDASPALADAMIAELAQAGLAESWQAALEIRGEASEASARIGCKEALRASQGLYRWFFMPVTRGEKAAVIMEASGEGGSGRATYVFRAPGGPESLEAAMDALNYALVLVNFRREPIYMTVEQMRKPENEHYLRSVERVPALAELRGNFIGRVAHTSPEAWRQALEGLLGKV